MQDNLFTPAKLIWTESDFVEMSWHDNRIHGIGFVDDFNPHEHELRLDLDYIHQWVVCEQETDEQGFWVSPSTLVFPSPSELSINGIEFGGTFILGIARTAERDTETTLGRQWKWEISFNTGGTISLWSYGFSQFTRRAPLFVPVPHQSLESSRRGPICFDKLTYEC